MHWIQKWYKVCEILVCRWKGHLDSWLSMFKWVTQALIYPSGHSIHCIGSGLRLELRLSEQTVNWRTANLVFQRKPQKRKRGLQAFNTLFTFISRSLIQKNKHLIDIPSTSLSKESFWELIKLSWSNWWLDANKYKRYSYFSFFNSLENFNIQ